MQLTGSLIMQFVHCPRQAWLFFHNIKTEHTNENVKIGKILHQLKYEGLENAEVDFLDLGIKLDRIKTKNGKLVVEEFKKSGKSIRGQFFQVLFYLYQLENKGIKAIGELIFDEKGKIDEKDLLGLDYEIKGFKLFVEFTENNKQELLKVIENLKNTLNGAIPEKLTGKSGKIHKNCKGCSYFEFCWI